MKISQSRYKGLSRRQTDVLAEIAIGHDLGHHPATLRILEQRGFIVGGEERIYGKGDSPIDRIPVTVTRYRMPIAEHIGFCQWCADTLPEESA